MRSIARRLDRAPSTISREVRRNGGSKDFRAAASDARAWYRGTEMADHKAFSHECKCLFL